MRNRQNATRARLNPAVGLGLNVSAFPPNEEFLQIIESPSVRAPVGGPVTDSKSHSSTSLLEMDREVIRCKMCGLVQYRTRTDQCRRCLRLLPAKLDFLAAQTQQEELPGDDRQLFEAWPNRATVENIGQRIRQLRESRGMTQSQLQARSRVSRSYLSRIESGQMTPSLGTLEKISEALSVGLNRFFIPESNGEALMEDPFIQGLRPYLKQLDWMQWQSILKRLQAITDHVTSSHVDPTVAPVPVGRNGNGAGASRSIGTDARPRARYESGAQHYHR